MPLTLATRCRHHAVIRHPSEAVVVVVPGRAGWTLPAFDAELRHPAEGTVVELCERAEGLSP